MDLSHRLIPESITSRVETVAPLAGTAVAVVLGLILVGRRPLTVDEASAIVDARGSVEAAIERSLEHNPGAVAHQALLALVTGDERSEWAARLPSVAAVGLAALLALWLGWSLGGRFVAVIASVLVGSATGSLVAAQSARPHALALAAVALSSALFAWAMTRGHVLRWGAYATATATLPLVHPIAAAAVVAHLAALVVHRHHVKWREAAPAYVLVVAAAGLFLGASALERANAEPADPLSLRDLGEGIGLAAGWNVVLVALAVFGIVCLARDPGRRWIAVLTGGLALAPVGALLVAGSAFPVVPDRALVVALPALAVAAAFGVAELADGRLRLAVGVAVGVIAVAGAAWWFTAPPREDWRGAARLVSGQTGPGDTVVVIPSRARSAFMLYAPNERFASEARGNEAWVVALGDSSSAAAQARSVARPPRFALLDERAFGSDLTVTHWVRP